MSSQFPDFDCPGCGQAREPVRVELFHVPSCAQDANPGAGTPCDPTPKFYSRLTTDFALGAPGQVQKMYVCDGTLFTTCGQWIGICNAGDQTGKSAAYVRILTVHKGYVQVYNGCSDTNPVVNNPIPGTVFKAGTPIFPAPPQWCQAQFDKIVADAIKNGDKIVISAILDQLAKEEQICFTAIPALDEEDDSEGWLFGFLKKGASACMRKLTNIFTGSVGTTLCMPEVPETDDAPETVGEGTVPKHYAYFTDAGCLAKGGAVGQGCADELNITTQKILKIWACAKSGDVTQTRLIVPDSSGQQLVSYKDTDGVFKWRMGEVWNWVNQAEVEVYNGTPIGVAAGLLSHDFGATFANAKAFKLWVDVLCQSASGDNIDYYVAANGIALQRGGVDNGSTDSFQGPLGCQGEVPADPTTPQVIAFAGSSGGPTGGVRNISIKISIQAWR